MVSRGDVGSSSFAFRGVVIIPLGGCGVSSIAGAKRLDETQMPTDAPILAPTPAANVLRSFASPLFDRFLELAEQIGNAIGRVIGSD
jgi:hypothetical protein